MRRPQFLDGSIQETLIFELGLGNHTRLIKAPCIVIPGLECFFIIITINLPGLFHNGGKFGEGFFKATKF